MITPLYQQNILTHDQCPVPGVLWYYCLASKGTMDITHEWCPKITSGEATSDFGTTSV
jgi:hypothetical protein